ncbi:MAG: ATP-binding cassette domain-containing protein [Nitrospinota bacterium]
MIRLESASYKAYPVNAENINFHLPRGETAILLGPRSSGKSDFLKACTGLTKLTSGLLFLMGEDITEGAGSYGVFEMRDIGFVTQQQTLMDNLTIAANIGLPLSYHLGVGEDELKNMVVPLMEKFGIDKSADRFPHEISAVEAKLGLMARAVVLGPRLLLLDEPTAGDMDPGGFTRVVSLIKRIMSEGVTMLITTSSPTFAALEGATLYYFVNGSLLEQRAAEESDDVLFRNYFQEISDFVHGPKQDSMERIGYIGRDRRRRE